MTAKPMNKADREKWYAEVVNETNKELARQDEIIRMAREVGLPHWYHNGEPVNVELLERFAALVAAHERKKCEQEMSLMEEHCAELILIEREAIAQMFDDAPKLITSAQNSEGGCLICGFTPKIAAAAIRARGSNVGD